MSSTRACSPRALKYLVCWWRADALLKTAMGYMQTDSPAETTQFLLHLNPLLGSLFGNVDIGPLTCKLTDPVSGQRTFGIVPGYVAPAAPPRSGRGGIGALDLLEGHATAIDYCVNAAVRSFGALSPRVQTAVDAEWPRYRFTFDEYAHAFSYYCLATGQVDTSFRQGIRHTYKGNTVYWHTQRLGQICLEALMMPLWRQPSRTYASWNDLHPGWRFFRMLNFVAANKEPEGPEDYNQLSKQLHAQTGFSRDDVFSWTIAQTERSRVFGGRDRALLIRALRLQQAHPDFHTATRHETRHAHLEKETEDFFSAFPVLVQHTDEPMFANSYQVFAGGGGIEAGTAALAGSRERLVRGLLADVIHAYMTSSQHVGIGDYARLLADIFPSCADVVHESLGELVRLEAGDFVSE